MDHIYTSSFSGTPINGQLIFRLILQEPMHLSALEAEAVFSSDEDSVFDIYLGEKLSGVLVFLAGRYVGNFVNYMGGRIDGPGSSHMKIVAPSKGETPSDISIKATFKTNVKVATDISIISHSTSERILGSLTPPQDKWVRHIWVSYTINNQPQEEYFKVDGLDDDMELHISGHFRGDLQYTGIHRMPLNTVPHFHLSFHPRLMRWKKERSLQELCRDRAEMLKEYIAGNREGLDYELKKAGD